VTRVASHGFSCPLVLNCINGSRNAAVTKVPALFFAWSRVGGAGEIPTLSTGMFWAEREPDPDAAASPTAAVTTTTARRVRRKRDFTAAPPKVRADTR
jgi:hypothetical protein